MKLYPHQIEALEKALPILQMYKLVYLVMEVRTGKTLTSLSLANQHLNGKPSTVAFITKKKAIPSIEADYKTAGFTYKLIVTNYESIHKIDDFVDLWILDEAHCLGQYPKPSIRTKQLRDLINNAHCILLSGTPTPESFSQIYHQLWVTGNSPFTHKNFYEWAKSGFVNIKQKMISGHKINDYSKADEALVNQSVGHLLISCSQNDAGFTSPVEEDFAIVPVNDVSRFIYSKIEADQVLDYSGRVFLADTPANMLNKFSQIAGGTLIDEDGKPLIFDDAKCRYIKQNYSDKRIAIYYRYKAELTLLTSFFPKHTTDWTDFERGSVSVFLSQIQSGREGISLRSADLIIMYNIDFSATSYWQVRARMQHRDKKDASRILWLFSDLGIEEQVYKAVSKKKNFTVSYYRKHGGKKGASQSKKEAGGSRLVSGQDHELQPTGLAGPASSQKRQDDFRGMQGSRKETNTPPGIQARKVTCDWL